jgi:hypothetical protein
MILDDGSTGIGLIAPPNRPPSVYHKINKRMRAISRAARRGAGGTRGRFRVLVGGLQRGQGILVSYIQLKLLSV